MGFTSKVAHGSKQVHKYTKKLDATVDAGEPYLRRVASRVGKRASRFARETRRVLSKTERALGTVLARSGKFTQTILPSLYTFLENIGERTPSFIKIGFKALSKPKVVTVALWLSILRHLHNNRSAMMDWARAQSKTSDRVKVMSNEVFSGLIENATVMNGRLVVHTNDGDYDVQQYNNNTNNFILTDKRSTTGTEDSIIAKLTYDLSTADSIGIDTIRNWMTMKPLFPDADKFHVNKVLNAPEADRPNVAMEVILQAQTQQFFRLITKDQYDIVYAVAFKYLSDTQKPQSKESSMALIRAIPIAREKMVGSFRLKDVPAVLRELLESLPGVLWEKVAGKPFSFANQEAKDRALKEMSEYTYENIKQTALYYNKIGKLTAVSKANELTPDQITAGIYDEHYVGKIAYKEYPEGIKIFSANIKVSVANLFPGIIGVDAHDLIFDTPNLSFKGDKLFLEQETTVSVVADATFNYTFHVGTKYAATIDVVKSSGFFTVKVLRSELFSYQIVTTHVTREVKTQIPWAGVDLLRRDPWAAGKVEIFNILG